MSKWDRRDGKNEAFVWHRVTAAEGCEGALRAIAHLRSAINDSICSPSFRTYILSLLRSASSICWSMSGEALDKTPSVAEWSLLLPLIGSASAAGVNTGALGLKPSAGVWGVSHGAVYSRGSALPEPAEVDAAVKDCAIVSSGMGWAGGGGESGSMVHEAVGTEGGGRLVCSTGQGKG